MCPGKQDQLGTYAHEREALFLFIGSESISGVVLMSGDVHRTRVIRHLSVKMAGYRTPELTTSPVHSGVIDNSNQPHPGLIFDCSTGNTFPLLTSSQRGAQAKLNTRFITKDGKTFFQQTYLARRLQKR